MNQTNAEFSVFVDDTVFIMDQGMVIWILCQDANTEKLIEIESLDQDYETFELVMLCGDLLRIHKKD